MRAVCLQVGGVDLNLEQTIVEIDEHFSDALWSSVDGLTLVTVFSDGALVDDVLQFARRIESRLPGAVVKRVHRDLVSSADIARRVGVSREAVRKWTKRRSPAQFPAPFSTVGLEGRGIKIWLWSEICDWLNRALALNLDCDELDSTTVAQVDGCLARVPDCTTIQWEKVSMGTFVTPHELRFNAAVQTSARAALCGTDLGAYVSSIFRSAAPPVGRLAVSTYTKLDDFEARKVVGA